MNPKDFQRLATLRLNEASALRDADYPSGAYYLAGHAVECALKACIAKLTRRHDFPPRQDRDNDCYTHDFSRLIRLAGLTRTVRDLERTHPQLNANWTIVPTMVAGKPI